MLLDPGHSFLKLGEFTGRIKQTIKQKASNVFPKELTIHSKPKCLSLKGYFPKLWRLETKVVKERKSEGCSGFTAGLENKLENKAKIKLGGDQGHLDYSLQRNLHLIGSVSRWIYTLVPHWNPQSSQPTSGVQQSVVRETESSAKTLSSQGVCAVLNMLPWETVRIRRSVHRTS